jgi:hypothetical protein
MRSAIGIIIVLLLIWGVMGLIDGQGFFGGIQAQFKAIWLMLGWVGRIVVIFIIVGLFLKAP